tara:strand:+ start:864 stop:2945 length:2082 start_codon:yes stop_codon:yes gene_type:complete
MLTLQKALEKNFIKLFSFKRNSRPFFIIYFLISFFIFNFSKAESNNSTAYKKAENVKDNLASKKNILEDYNFDSEIKKLNPKNINQIDIDYIKSKKDLEDYIIDTGDALYIEFENAPRGLNSLDEENQNEFNPNDLSYLEPKNDLSNYILDEGDIINIKFKNIAKGDPELLNKNIKNKPLVTEYLTPVSDLNNYRLDEGDTISITFKNTPKLNARVELDKLGEVFLPRIKDTYIRGLTIYQLTKILKERYQEFLIDPEIEIRIVKYRFINSGNYKISKLGEIFIPKAKNLYVKGLKIGELEKLLEEKYREFGLFTDIEIRVSKFKFIGSGIYNVDLEGEIFLPKIKETYVRGLTPSELSQIIQKKYKEFNINAKTTVKIAIFKKLRILVGGEVRSPGIYNFPAFTAMNFNNIIDDLDEDGREKSFFESNQTILKEENKMKDQSDVNENAIKEINEDSIVDYQDNSQSQNLDNIVRNNLNNKSNFQIKRPSDNFTTISNAIKKAGGITSRTDLSRIEIIRDIPIGKGGGKKRAIIDFTSFLNESDPTNDIRLFDGDRIFLPKLASASSNIIPKSILSGLSPRFIKVNIFGRVENPGTIILPLEASLSDAIDLTGPIKPLSGKIVLIRYNVDGTILKKNISYSAGAKRGSKRNPFVKEGDLISVKNSFFGKTTGLIREITAPFVGIYSTKELFDD